MFTALRRLWRYLFPTETPAEVLPARDRLFSTDMGGRGTPKPEAVREWLNERLAKSAPKLVPIEGVATDSFDISETVLSEIGAPDITDALFAWFGLQSFIGHQMCAIIAQHWLIDRACSLPARDAISKGFSVTIPDQPDETQVKIKDRIAELNIEMGVTATMYEHIRQGRVFGIRVALFKIKTADDKTFYENPFNPDAVTPGSYEGISQIDPYWLTPILDEDGIRDPASPNFYVPTWWQIQGRRYHKSHLVIFTTGELPDLLKPSYLYGGVSVPQRIMERVYAAERTANEAPQLAMTKRLTVWNTDVAHILANQDRFAQHMDNFIRFRDNYSMKINDTEDKMEQFDTTLTGVQDIIEGQYDLVAAGAGVPITKLFGKSPKGSLSGSGNYEEENYREELKTLQSHDLSPLLDRHHLLLGRSVVAPEFGISPDKLKIRHTWEPLDTPTAKELADTNLVKAQADNSLVQAGAIDGEDVRNRLRTETDSGYHGISAEVPEPEPVDGEDPSTPSENVGKEKGEGEPSET
jgi:phage-related protein (TIGR01555 family)